MVAVLKLVDEDFGKPVSDRRSAGELRLASQRTSARAIIAERVAQEVNFLNAKARSLVAQPTRSFLVAPDAAERALNQPLPLRPARQLDAVAETERACAAFAKRRFLLLVDDVQLDGLDDEIGFGDASEVIFLHLSPLKGG